MMADFETGNETMPPIQWTPFELHDGELTARLITKHGETGAEEIGFITLKPFNKFILEKNIFVYPTYRGHSLSNLLGKKISQYIAREKKYGLSNNGGDIQPARRRGWPAIPGHPTWFIFIPPKSGLRMPSLDDLEQMINEADPAYMHRISRK